eukprot:RCo049656
MYFLGDGEEAEEAEEQFMEDEEYEPSEQEILEYCEWLGMDPENDRALMWIAREALKAPLPDNWKICYTEDREVYYFNIRNGESIWDHPMDAYYKALFRQEKAKLEKKRKKMRLYSGSFPVLPLQEYFTMLSEEDEELFNRSGHQQLSVEIPEHLQDPIDLRLYVDPVVLPTSGRTVSKHTIVNNKWRDPFSREYIENRRLIPNIDKRNEVTLWLQKTMEQHFEEITRDNTLAAVLKLLPFVLDKECEVSLKFQSKLLSYFKKLFALKRAPASTSEEKPSLDPTGAADVSHSSSRRARSNGPNTSTLEPFSSSHNRETSQAAEDTEPNNPVTLSRGYYEVSRLPDAEVTVLLGCLLTMSTTTSAEILYLLLDSVPALRAAPVLRGFGTEVLNVLHLNTADIAQMAAQCMGEAPRRTVGSSHASEEDSTTPRGPPPRGGGLEFGGASGAAHIPLCRRPSSSDDLGSESSVPPEGDVIPSRAYKLDLCTSNGDYLCTLRWVLLLMDYPTHLNILEKLPWDTAIHVVVLILNSIPDEAKARMTFVCRLLRGLRGWPHDLHDPAASPPEVLQWLVELTLLDPNPWNTLLLLYDILVFGGEAGSLPIKANRDKVVAVLREAAVAPDAAQGVTYASMLGALLVFQDCCRLGDYSANPRLQLSVAFDLFPRLTRQQWRPRHFEQTMQEMLQCIRKAPEVAWEAMGAKAVEFLVKELSKKKKNSEMLRVKLEDIEATEKRLQAAVGTVNWALMYLKLHSRRVQRAAGERPAAGDIKRLELLSELTQRNEAKKKDLLLERASNLLILLQTLMSTRLKPKQSRENRDLSRKQMTGTPPMHRPPSNSAAEETTTLP